MNMLQNVISAPQISFIGKYSKVKFEPLRYIEGILQTSCV